MKLTPQNPHSHELPNEAIQVVLWRWCGIFPKAMDGPTAFFEKFIPNQPLITRNNSILTGQGWLDELLNSKIPKCFYDQLGMKKKKMSS